jgi:hypothetical protein
LVAFLESDGCLPPDHLQHVDGSCCGTLGGVHIAGWWRFSVEGGLLDENPTAPFGDAFAAGA